MQRKFTLNYSPITFPGCCLSALCLSGVMKREDPSWVVLSNIFRSLGILDLFPSQKALLMDTDKPR